MHTRINVSIPPETRDKMLECKDPPNWSELATTAIELYFSGNEYFDELLRLQDENKKRKEALQAIHSLSGG